MSENVLIIFPKIFKIPKPRVELKQLNSIYFWFLYKLRIRLKLTFLLKI